MRFIPAGAGNSITASRSISAAPVYPRRRGELAHRLRHTVKKFGLSPQARGTLIRNHPLTQGLRFIPAGAGNSSPNIHAQLPRTVYPRRRGELIAGYPRPVTQNGLSPQARGTHMPGLNRLNMLRFIPAGAGNSSRGAGPRWRQPVYPRRRGELERRSMKKLIISGLSPQARGTLRDF